VPATPVALPSAATTPPLRSADLDALVDVLAGRSVVVLSGAGISTESGIPDYRGPETRRKARNPVRYRQFMREAEARRHYWARSAVGWPAFAAAEPNDAHRALAQLEAVGLVRGIITQNVDRLHQAAGSERVVELHGALHEIECLGCGGLSAREAFQARLHALNPGWGRHAGAEIAPDGDAEVGYGATSTFRVPACEACGGALKPHVVFFGENVPAARVDDAWALLAEGDALLVVGSSLAVFSGYRFVRQAAKDGQPVAIVNLGPTRGDGEAAVRVEARLGETLPRLCGRLLRAPSLR
jgi:NAD-dependent SIR2 family protein deacetylase